VARLLNANRTENMSKPKVFIASSVEGLSVAYSVQTNLNHDADCTVWSQGIFELSTPPIDSLVATLDSSDFAIFVFSPDDEVRMREQSANAVRDNVLFELGLFIGRLGKVRCFIVAPDAPTMHVASDLTGVTSATYSSSRDIAELSATLGPPCHQIRLAMQRLGRVRPESKAGHIPARVADDYDDDDKEILLADWLNTTYADSAYKFEDVDKSLKLDRGTTFRLLSKVVGETGFFAIAKSSKNFFTLARADLND
jgi:hypothetical protein